MSGYLSGLFHFSLDADSLKKKMTCVAERLYSMRKIQNKRARVLTSGENHASRDLSATT